MIWIVLRTISALFLGLIAGGTLIAGLEWVGHQIDPPPIALKQDDPEFLAKVAQVVEQLPLRAFLMILLAYAVGVATASAIAARLAPAVPWVHGLTVGAVFLLATIANLIMIPHPLWFAVAAVLACPVASIFGCWLGAWKDEEPSNAT